MSEAVPFFADHGWIILKGVLTSQEVAQITQAYDEVIGAIQNLVVDSSNASRD